MDYKKAQRSNPLDVNAALRLEQALALRARRYTYEQIAVECGYAHRGKAHDAIQRAMKSRINTSVDHLRAEELDMLDRLHSAVWLKALGDPTATDSKERKSSLFAVDRVLAISEARRKLLGLDLHKDTPVGGTVIIREYAQGVAEGV